jgi:spheroidene monooxygenase
MQVVTLSTYRFRGAANLAWAFLQMQLARGPLARIPGIGFHKMFGSGSGASFHPKPNLSVYGLLAAWPSFEVAHQQLSTADVFRRYRDHADEAFTCFLKPIHATGAWDGGQPFEPTRVATLPTPLGVLTRATIRSDRLLDFWKSVPRVSDSLVSDDGALFAIGLGEIPWLHQVTFSIWPDVQTMHRFAYKSGAHAEAIKQAKTNTWFKEDLFARFEVLASEGHWSAAKLPGTLVAA